MTTRTLRVAEDAATFVERAAEWIAREVEAAVAARGCCSLALSGGATPQPVHARLAEPPFERAIPWGRLDVFFADERGVPPDDPASNYHQAWAALLGHVPLGAGRVHRMEGERPDLDGAAAAYAASLPDRLDVLVLGMGEDGHTASLFPGAPALLERDRLVVAVEDAPRPWRARLTITPPVIERARSVLVLVRGPRKAARVAEALSAPDEPERLPIQLARRGTWIIDAAAAATLREHAP